MSLCLTHLIHIDRATPSQCLQMPWRQIAARPSATTMLFGYIACHGYHVTSIKQKMFERGREVGHPSVSLLLTGSPSDDDNALCDIHNLSMKTQWNTRLKACLKPVYNNQYVRVNRHSMPVLGRSYMNAYITNNICIWICLTLIVVI